MNWIRVSERLPADRRLVLVWAISTAPWRRPSTSGYPTLSRFNWSSEWRGQWDCERKQWCVVTHWAEIEPPSEVLPR